MRMGAGVSYEIICALALYLQPSSLTCDTGESASLQKIASNMCKNLRHTMPLHAPEGVLPYTVYPSTMQCHRPCVFNPNAFLSCPSCPTNAHSVLCSNSISRAKAKTLTQSRSTPYDTTHAQIIRKPHHEDSGAISSSRIDPLLPPLLGPTPRTAPRARSASCL